ncbi:hypothetical protein ONZ51_g9752 [Trametes cubensis]|uniref:Carbohydrate esterase family 16 protein n=1 Tax=Trametes cubensis TaxID=1111947 RepID=A0AAD7TNA5_9APHY|nr:hypothetical protein ONZ51_g9752 [Trametes cubensis]
MDIIGRCTKSRSDSPPDQHRGGEEIPEDRPMKNRSETSPGRGLPTTSRYLIAASGGKHWHADHSLQRIVVLGDSYSKSSNGEKTWVDHFVQHLRDANQSPQIYNLAFPGATAQDDLAGQVSRLLALLTQEENDQPNVNSSLHPDRSTYFVFMGINDCGSNDIYDLESIVEAIDDAIHILYVKAGARNFVLIDVPPINRSPQATNAGMSEEIDERVKKWNELLRGQIAEFGTSSREATTFLFSSHQVLSDVMDNPDKYDLAEDDPETGGGGIWEDDLHLAAEVHGVLADCLLKALRVQH